MMSPDPFGRTRACDAGVSQAAALGAAARSVAPPSASLRDNFVWTLTAHLVAAGCKFLQLMVLAKMGTRDMVGQFAYALALTGPLVMLTNLQLRNVQATDARGQFTFETYLGVRLAGTAIALGAIVVLGVAYAAHGVLWTVLAMGLAKAVEATSDIFHGLQQRHERMGVIAGSMMAKELLSVAAMSVVLWLTGSVSLATLGLAAGATVVLLAYDLPRGRALWRGPRGSRALRPRLTGAGSLVRLALPLGVVMMLASLGTNVPRYVVEHQLGVGELGVFSAVAYIGAVGLTAVGALGHSAAPRLSRHHAAGDRRAFVRLMAVLLGLATFLGIAGVAISAIGGRTLLSLLFRPEYGDAQPVLVWTMVGATAAYVGSAFEYGLTAARSIRAQAPLWIAMLITTGIGCVLLVPRHGLVGAAMATSAGYLVQGAGAGWLLARAVRRREAR